MADEFPGHDRLLTTTTTNALIPADRRPDLCVDVPLLSSLSPALQYVTIPSGYSPTALLGSPSTFFPNDLQVRSSALPDHLLFADANEPNHAQFSMQHEFDVPVYFPEQESENPKCAAAQQYHLTGDIGFSRTGTGRLSEDGYNWKKYGQKQVKGSEYPRSYFKCTHPTCLVKKKVEHALDGRVREIEYMGSHNHPQPQIIPSVENPYISKIVAENPEPLSGIKRKNSNEGEEENNGEYYEPESKKRKKENYPNESRSTPCAVREQKIVVQTVSDVDILEDGYRWRKYGQKVVKGNPNPRSYYKCTTPGCIVRKHIERAPNDLKSVMTTYEGKHKHPVPIARTGPMTTPVPANVPKVPEPQRLPPVNYSIPYLSSMPVDSKVMIPTFSGVNFPSIPTFGFHMDVYQRACQDSQFVVPTEVFSGRYSALVGSNLPKKERDSYGSPTSPLDALSFLPDQ